MKKAIAYIFFIICSFSAQADNWSFKKELKEESYQFGDLTVKKVRDTRQNQSYPAFRTVLLKGGKEIANIKDLTFDRIVSVGGGHYLLGVSNSGLSTFALFIIDRSGNLVRATKHSSEINYCRESITLVREWVDLKNLDIREEYETSENQVDSENPDGSLKSVTVRGCGNSRVEVWSP